MKELKGSEGDDVPRHQEIFRIMAQMPLLIPEGAGKARWNLNSPGDVPFCVTHLTFFFLPLPSFLLRFYSLLGATSHAQDVLPSAFLSSSYGANNARATFLFWYLSPVPSVCDLLRFRICRATIHTRRMTATVVRKHIIVYLKLHRCICLAIFVCIPEACTITCICLVYCYISFCAPTETFGPFSLNIQRKKHPHSFSTQTEKTK
ncbi:uncharacterized protein TEOVI_000886200 [Trypanosoma equiperdum]|uniref:Uncharacterized protein n=1 Tax=Trypanosoma equiperdum TaxID=5694 RepID=A0A1G4HZ58_TRYEQ|nr:hypothetical protein, conserved [Trypanosoma equiperdum]